MTPADLRRQLAEQYGGFPADSFVVVSFGSSGFKPEEDYICEIGTLDVADGEIAEQRRRLIDWPGYLEGIHPEAAEAVRKQIERLSKGASDFSYSWQAMKNSGFTPGEAISELHRQLQGRYVVSNNGLSFDATAYRQHLADFHPEVVDPGMCPVQAWIDTGAFTRALQTQTVPFAGESYQEWTDRTRGQRGVRWNLAFCEDAYDLTGYCETRWPSFAALPSGALRDAYRTLMLYWQQNGQLENLSSGSGKASPCPTTRQ